MSINRLTKQIHNHELANKDYSTLKSIGRACMAYVKEDIALRNVDNPSKKIHH